jgi:hypothetical protein
MIDPISIGAAFAVAKAAVAGVKEAIALGHEIQDCYHEISTFFDKQAEIELAIVDQKQAKLEQAKTGIKPERSATAEALDAMFASRQMIRLEKELKEALIYGTGESGLYDEMCERRDAIVAERKQEIEETERQDRMRLAAIRRKKEERIQNIQEWLAVVLGVTFSSLIMWAVWWMFKHRDE